MERKFKRDLLETDFKRGGNNAWLKKAWLELYCLTYMDIRLIRIRRVENLEKNITYCLKRAKGNIEDIGCSKDEFSSILKGRYIAEIMRGINYLSGWTVGYYGMIAETSANITASFNKAGITLNDLNLPKYHLEECYKKAAISWIIDPFRDRSDKTKEAFEWNDIISGAPNDGIKIFLKKAKKDAIKDIEKLSKEASIVIFAKYSNAFGGPDIFS